MWKEGTMRSGRKAGGKIFAIAPVMFRLGRGNVREGKGRYLRTTLSNMSLKIGSDSRNSRPSLAIRVHLTPERCSVRLRGGLKARSDSGTRLPLPHRGADDAWGRECSMLRAAPLQTRPPPPSRHRRAAGTWPEAELEKPLAKTLC